MGATARAVPSPPPRATRCTAARPRGGRLAGCSRVPLAAVAAGGAIGSVLALRDNAPPAEASRAAAARARGLRCAFGSSAREHPLGHAVRLRTRTVRRRRRGPVGVAAAAVRAAAAARRCPHARADASVLRLPWIPLGRLATAGGFVWAAQDDGPELARISTASGRLERFRPNDSPSTGLAAGDGTLWVATDGHLARVVPVNGTTGSRIPYDGSGRITFGDGALWSLEGAGTLRKLDSETGRVLAATDLPATVTDVAVADGLVWAVGRARTASSTGSTSATFVCGASSRLARIRSGSRSRATGSGSRTARRGRSPSLDLRSGERTACSTDRCDLRRRSPTVTESSGPGRCLSRRLCRRPAGPSCGSRCRGIPHPRPGRLALDRRRATRERHVRRTCSPIPTRRAWQGCASSPRSPRRCRGSRPTAARTPSASAAASASHRRRTSR